MTRTWGGTLAFLMVIAGPIRGDGIIFPKDAGVLNVKDYGAKGNGLNDDTAAIQKALDAYPNGGRVIYLPNGTYRISSTLKWPHGTREGSEEKNTILQGQSREKTILRLTDGCAGYGDPKAPKSMIWTGQAPAQRSRNAIRDMTIDTGRRNPGVIGLQFMANKQGCLRDVTIRSGDGKAVTGLDLAYTDENGPCLIKNVKIVGFDYGVRAANVVNSLTIEHLTLENQHKFGLVNEGQCLSIRGLTSRNEGPAIVNSGGEGVLVLVDADLRGTRSANAKPAVLNDAFLYARNVTSVGYAETIRNAANDRRPERGRTVAEFVSHSTIGDSGSMKPLSVKETPDVPWDDLKDWSSPTHFGARPDDEGDDSEAIQKAIDSGKTTVYFPCGAYKLGKTVVIRGKVRRLIGCEASLIAEGLKGEPAFRMQAGSAQVVVFERFGGGYAATPTLDNASSRTLVIKDCCNTSGRFTGTGDLFLEDVCSSPYSDWRFGNQNVWARQLNVVNEGTHVINDGCLWVLGFKTERGGTLVETRAKASTEILGGFCDTTTDPKGAPMFTIDGGSLRATIGESSSAGTPYEGLVRGGKKDVKRGEVPSRTGGSVLPLYVSPSP